MLKLVFQRCQTLGDVFAFFMFFGIGFFGCCTVNVVNSTSLKGMISNDRTCSRLIGRQSHQYHRPSFARGDEGKGLLITGDSRCWDDVNSCFWRLLLRVHTGLGVELHVVPTRGKTDLGTVNFKRIV